MNGKKIDDGDGQVVGEQGRSPPTSAMSHLGGFLSEIIGRILRIAQKIAQMSKLWTGL